MLRLVASLHVLVDLGLEGGRVALHDVVDGRRALLVVVEVAAADAVALGPADPALGEAVAVQLQALRLLAVACQNACGRGRLAGAGVSELGRLVRGGGGRDLRALHVH